jgi:hypothetical protein
MMLNLFFIDALTKFARTHARTDAFVHYNVTHSYFNIGTILKTFIPRGTSAGRRVVFCTISHRNPSFRYDVNAPP